MAKSLHFFTPSSNLTLPLQQFHHQPYLKPSPPASHRKFPVTLRSRSPILPIKASSSTAAPQLVLERNADAFSSPSSSSYYSSAPTAADSSSIEADAVMEAELNGSRITKLIFTIGPATCGFEQLEALAVGGMKVARINACHGTREWHRRVIERVRRLNEEKGFEVAIMLDIEGSEIHMGDLAGASSAKAEDWLDIDFGIAERVDFLAISSVKSAEVIYHLKSYIAARSHDSDIAVIAKIENVDSLKNLEEIIQASDGAMVVRGDLGAQIPLEQVPSAQQKIVQLCRQLNKPVILASHLLENQKDSENDTETYLEEGQTPKNGDEWPGHPALESDSKKGEKPLSDNEKEPLKLISFQNPSDEEAIDLSQFRKFWAKCDTCERLIHHKVAKKSLNVCDECGDYIKIDSLDRIEFVMDQDSWDSKDQDMTSFDAIGWDDSLLKEEHEFYLQEQREAYLLDQDKKARRALQENGLNIHRAMYEPAALELEFLFPQFQDACLDKCLQIAQAIPEAGKEVEKDFSEENADLDPEFWYFLKNYARKQDHESESAFS